MSIASVKGYLASAPTLIPFPLVATITPLVNNVESETAIISNLPVGFYTVNYSAQVGLGASTFSNSGTVICGLKLGNGGSAIRNQQTVWSASLNGATTASTPTSINVEGSYTFHNNVVQDLYITVLVENITLDGTPLSTFLTTLSNKSQIIKWG